MSASPTQPQRPERPLSPHLQVYKPQITSVMSILHRLTGVGLTVGLLILVSWLVSLAMGPEDYENFVRVIREPVFQYILFGLTLAFFYHLCSGIRHLLWDAGFFLSIKGVYSTGRIALGVSTLLTIIIWLKIFGYEVMP